MLKLRHVDLHSECRVKEMEQIISSFLSNVAKSMNVKIAHIIIFSFCCVQKNSDKIPWYQYSLQQAYSQPKLPYDNAGANRLIRKPIGT